MKKRVMLAAVVMGLAIALLAVSGYAAKNDPTHDPVIQERFERQQSRIDQGVKSGALTPDEAKLVQDNLDRIKADEAQLKAAGKLTVKEKDRIMKKLDQNGRMIKKERNNAIRKID